MSKYPIERKDDIDLKLISKIIQKVDQMNSKYVDSESDLIFKQQPFLISIILGYKIDLKPAELEEVTKLIFLIWEYFKENPKIKTTQVTKSQFERIERKNLFLIKYYEGETTEKDKMIVLASNMEHLDSKGLLTAMYLRCNTQIPLAKMEISTKGILMIGLKSLIECFDEIKNS
ncbi:MAG TPA: hypothetical protein VIK10_04910 [Prolixibacteraceae bacterium]